MRRSILGFAILAVFSVFLTAAVYADTGTTKQTAGWLYADMVGTHMPTIQSDVQGLVGATKDTLMSDLGPSSVMSSDGSGGTDYFYIVPMAGTLGGPNQAELWADVDSTGKVLKVNIAS